MFQGKFGPLFFLAFVVTAIVTLIFRALRATAGYAVNNLPRSR
jgi:predicted secreted protein